MFGFEVAIDFIFIIDIIVNCRTAYVTAEGELESRHLMIAKQYSTSWFFIDLVSSIPIDLILLTTTSTNAEGGGEQHSELKVTRLFKGLRLVRLLKLLRLLKITKYLKLAQVCTLVDAR